MDLFWKTAALILLALILGTVLERQERDLGVLLTVLVCCIAAAAGLSCLEIVWELLRELKTLAGLEGDVMDALLKITGIALVSELLSSICADAGNSALGKSLQFTGSAVILYLSVPVFRSVLLAVRDILGVL